MIRLKPGEGVGVIPREEWGVGMGLDEFFRLRECWRRVVLVVFELELRN